MFEYNVDWVERVKRTERMAKTKYLKVIIIRQNKVQKKKKKMYNIKYYNKVIIINSYWVSIGICNTGE